MSSGAPGTPGSAGAPGRGQGKEEGKHERAKYLDSREHIDDAIGENVDATKPVVGGAPPRPAAPQPTIVSEPLRGGRDSNDSVSAPPRRVPAAPAPGQVQEAR